MRADWPNIRPHTPSARGPTPRDCYREFPRMSLLGNRVNSDNLPPSVQLPTLRYKPFSAIDWPLYETLLRTKLVCRGYSGSGSGWSNSDWLLYPPRGYKYPCMVAEWFVWLKRWRVGALRHRRWRRRGC